MENERVKRLHDIKTSSNSETKNALKFDYYYRPSSLEITYWSVASMILAQIGNVEMVEILSQVLEDLVSGLFMFCLFNPIQIYTLDETFSNSFVKFVIIRVKQKCLEISFKTVHSQLILFWRYSVLEVLMFTIQSN